MPMPLSSSCSGGKGLRPPGAPRANSSTTPWLSAHIWALSHGVVELFARGVPGGRSPIPAEQLLESGMGIYLRGLGLIAPD